MDRPATPPAARLRRTAALILGFAAALLASEALLRVAYLSPGQYRLDPVLGVDRVPHSGVFVGREGGARLVFDRHGLNNDDQAWDRPGPRLAILGDSYTEAAEVPRAENTVSRLAALRPELVLLNLGRAALTPPQAVELHRRLAERERFDLLLLSLSDNDLNDLAAAPELGPDCRLPEQPVGWGRHVMASLVGASPLLTRMRLRAREWWDGLRGSAARADAADPDPGLEARLVSCLRQIAARQPLVVAILPDGRRPLTAASQEAGRRRVALYARAARAAGAVAVIDAWSAFGADPLGDGRMVNGFPNDILGKGHFNPLGHARLAEVLAEGLAPLLPAAEQVPRVAQGRAQGRAQGMAQEMAKGMAR